MKILRKLFTLFRRRKLDAEMSDEMRHHVELQSESNVKAGMHPQEAYYAALRKFGNIAKVQQQARERRGGVWIMQSVQDFGYAIRQLRKAPGFASTVIFTIAIGIGACAALFSMINGVLLRPLPFPDQERIVVIDETRPPSEVIPVAPAVYLDWLRESSVFEGIAIMGGRSYTMTSGDHLRQIGAQWVSANFFSVIGVQPMLGRAFLPGEDKEGASNVVILSYRTWQNDFGGRPNVINEVIQLDNRSFTIVGVMPDQNLIWDSSIFTPRAFSADDRVDYGSHGLGCIARLKAGVSLESARREMAEVSQGIARAHPDSCAGHGARLRSLLETLTGDVRLQLLILLGAVGFLFLIACVNVANLLLARANVRAREIALRASLGASRGRIIRQFICEGLLITLVGGGLGVLLAYGSMGTLARFARHYVPRTDQFVIDGAVLATIFGLMLLAGVGVGLVPAFQATRGDIIDALKDSSRSTAGTQRQRARSWLVILEIALSLILLAGTGLLARSLLALRHVDQGFKADDVYIGQLWFGPGTRYDSTAKSDSFIKELIRQLSSLPGIDSAACSTGLPMTGTDGLLFSVVGSPERPITAMPQTKASSITPDFFKAMSIPLVQGRGFNAGDEAGTPRVVIVNQQIALKYFPGKDPIGQRIMIMTMADKLDAVREIVGVVGNVNPSGPQSEIVPQVYEPFAQKPQLHVNLIVRAKGKTPDLAVTVGDLLRSLDPTLPFQGLNSYHSIIAKGWFRQQFSMVVLSLFSGVALLLASIGIYGVTSYSVIQRTQEIGIRMALGAQVGDVFWLILSNGGRMVIAGLVLGTAGSAASARVFRSLLFNTNPYDAPTLIVAASVLASAAFTACWLPARRATKVDPVVALRAE